MCVPPVSDGLADVGGEAEFGLDLGAVGPAADEVRLGDHAAAEQLLQAPPRLLGAVERFEPGGLADHHFVAAGALDGYELPRHLDLGRVGRLDHRDRRRMGPRRRQPVVPHEDLEAVHQRVLEVDPHGDLPVLGRPDRRLPEHGDLEAAVAHPVGEQERHRPDAGLLDVEIQQDRLLDRPVGHADVAGRLAADDRLARREPHGAAVVRPVVVQGQRGGRQLPGFEPVADPLQEHALAVLQPLGLGLDARIDLHGDVALLTLDAEDLQIRQRDLGLWDAVQFRLTLLLERAAEHHRHLPGEPGAKINREQRPPGGIGRALLRRDRPQGVLAGTPSRGPSPDRP